jgi:hypothetical protein
VGAKSNRRVDEDEQSRVADPNFYGVYPQDGTRATLLEIGETLHCIGYNIAKLLSLGTLINAAPTVVAVWVPAEALVFLLWRVHDDEWRASTPGNDNASFSLFNHIMAHVTLIAYPNSPVRNIGFFYGPMRYACMIVGTLALINPVQLCLSLYLSDAHPSLGMAPINVAPRTLLFAWAAATLLSVAGAAMMFVFMSESHRKTFYQRMPIGKRVREWHWHSRTAAKIGEGQDAARAQTLMLFVPRYLPQAEVKVWLRDGWPEWEKTNPVWFTEYWKKQVRRRLKHLLPVEVFATFAKDQYVAKLERLMEPPLIAVDVAEIEETLPNAEAAGVDLEQISRARVLCVEASDKQALVLNGTECDFYLVRAECIVSCTDKVMPAFRELRRNRPDWLVRETITIAKVCAGAYREEYLAVSHRWEDPQVPDGLGVQMDAIRDYLREHTHIRLVFFARCQGSNQCPATLVLGCCSHDNQLVPATGLVKHAAGRRWQVTHAD